MKHAKTLDAVIVDTKDFKALQLDPSEWNMKDLVGSHGFLRIKRPSVIIDRDTNLIMGLNLTGLEVPELTALVGLLPSLHSVLKERMAPNPKRPGLCMIGYRWNKQWCCSERSRSNLYYCAKTLKHAIKMYRDKDTKALLLKVASTMCRLERLVSPAMGLHRMSHAILSKHPGIWPLVSRWICSAPSLGLSRGYVSKVHRDMGFLSMVEMIVWNSFGVPKRSGYCFCLVDAGVVIDLISPLGVMCMVPGSVRHGTPNLNAGFDPDHTGIGAVILNKTNLATPKAIKGTEEIQRRLDDNYASNPFVAKFAIDVEMECEMCSSLASTRKNPILLCDECNCGYHAKCLTPQPTPSAEEAWYCPTCRPLVEEEVRNPSASA